MDSSIIAATTSHRAKQEALRRSPFGSLTEAELDDIVRLSDLRTFKAGSVLCRQAEFSQEAFVIAAGIVSVVVDGVEVARRGRGQIVGDWALFGDGHRTASLRAATSVTAVVVDPCEVDSLLMAVPSAAHELGPIHQTPIS